MCQLHWLTRSNRGHHTLCTYLQSAVHSQLLSLLLTQAWDLKPLSFIYLYGCLKSHPHTEWLSTIILSFYNFHGYFLAGLGWAPFHGLSPKPLWKGWSVGSQIIGTHRSGPGQSSLTSSFLWLGAPPSWHPGASGRSSGASSGVSSEAPRRRRLRSVGLGRHSGCSDIRAGG